MIKGLVGEKLGHSYSKIIHEMLGSDLYNLYSLTKEEFNDFFINKNFDFVNVTIPYKQDVIPYLDYIHPSAEKIGAVNLVINKNGILSGYNTDYDGFKYLLESNNIKINNKKCLILGSGATSKTVYTVLKDMNASLILKASRTKTENTITYDEIYNYDFEIIINTTPIGMYPNINKTLVDLSKFNNLIFVGDCVYNPLRTRLIIDALKLGIKCDTGLKMLIIQAVKAHEIYYNQIVDFDKFNELFKFFSSNKKNIVLIGMPGCGKSTVGRNIASKLRKEFIDIDEYIESKSGMKISEIFSKYGEEYFRDLEYSACLEIALKDNLVVSTGGGVVKREENINVLKSNGIICYIERDLEKTILDDNRPLSKSIDDLKRLYEERKELYEKSYDFKISNNGKLSKTVEKILGKIV